jgi:beta-lactam-binding protein with PASTA domain
MTAADTTFGRLLPRHLRSSILVAVTLLVVACGDPVGSHMITVPEVDGLTAAAAERRLQALGLRWRYGAEGPIESRAGSLDEVAILDQEPSAGSRVARGFVVRLETLCTLSPSAMGISCVDR